MKVPSIEISFPKEARQQILQRIDEVLQTGQLTLGKYGKEFEEKFARLHQADYAIAVNSGTSALEISLRALGVEGKEVLVPTNTFFATPAAVLHAGGKVRFVDADPETFSVSVDELEKRITENTAGVIVVHIAGIVTPQMPLIRAFCQERGIFLLEDAAHAQGASYNGEMAGTFGQAAAFSFYPTKIMTSGEGGMIVTRDPKVYQEALLYRDQGKEDFSSNFHVRLGYNWRLSEVHAIIGAAQLDRLDEAISGRRKIAAIYDEGLRETPGITPVFEPPGVFSNYYKYIALLDDGIERSALKRLLREKYEVALSGEVYTIPCHQQPIFGSSSEGQFPVAEDICARHICLPMFPTMSNEQADYVVDALASAIREVAG